MRKKANLLGKKMGLLRIVEERPPTPRGHSSWLCLCDCGNYVVRTSTSMKRSKASSCGCWRAKGSESPLYKGAGEISGNWFWNVIYRAASGRKSRYAIERKLEIDIQFVWDLFLKQEKKCALSGIVLTFPKSGSNKEMKASTASLDRIDSSKGYLKDNVQWVHKDINRMKNVYSQEYFISMCKAVSTNSAGGNCEIA
jgi:hypothetical protein